MKIIDRLRLRDWVCGGPATAAYAVDVVGIGALNLDYIATAPAVGTPAGESLTSRIQDPLAGGSEPPGWGTERGVDTETIHTAIEMASSTELHATLGGSAFNAIRAIVQTKVGLRLGYVGVAGRVPVVGLSPVAEFEELGIGHRFVRQAEDTLCGICLSIVEGGDRTLLTHAGANDQMADHLQRSFAGIVDYLASARVVHVTSFLDDRTAGSLLSVLQAVKRLGSGTLISFDPGHMWSVNPTPEIKGLIRISDYLLLNNREFRELGQHHDDEGDEVVAARLLEQLHGDAGVVVLKRTAGVWCYQRGPEDAVAGSFYPQSPLPTEDIEDSTGAGDVFAAGLLVVLAYDRLQIELGSLLGMRLARHKLRYVGSAGDAQFAAVARDLIATLDAERRANRSEGVFIAHGANPEWLAVRRFVEERFNLPVYSFESSSWSSRPVTDALADYLDRCSFAICVLTTEDFTGDGKRLARQNVVHEVGLFQGRHGFDRVLVLAEEGCDFVPHTAKPYTIEFPRNGIGNALYQVGEMIRATGFEDTGSGG